tara:strand:+ start:405 stop:566 length:162 start_codon:yes stop_codon:yes gene_type:complete
VQLLIDNELLPPDAGEEWVMNNLHKPEYASHGKRAEDIEQQDETVSGTQGTTS